MTIETHIISMHKKVLPEILCKDWLVQDIPVFHYVGYVDAVRSGALIANNFQAWIYGDAKRWEKSFCFEYGDGRELLFAVCIFQKNIFWKRFQMFSLHNTCISD